MSIEVSPELFKKLAGSSLTKDRPEADVEQSLEDENTKLRELVKKMFKRMKVMDMEWCSLPDYETVYDAAQIYDFDAENAPEYEEELRELGIEVD